MHNEIIHLCWRDVCSGASKALDMFCIQLEAMLFRSIELGANSCFGLRLTMHFPVDDWGSS